MTGGGATGQQGCHPAQCAGIALPSRQGRIGDQNAIQDCHCSMTVVHPLILWAMRCHKSHAHAAHVSHHQDSSTMSGEAVATVLVGKAGPQPLPAMSTAAPRPAMLLGKRQLLWPIQHRLMQHQPILQRQGPLLPQRLQGPASPHHHSSNLLVVGAQDGAEALLSSRCLGCAACLHHMPCIVGTSPDMRK